MKILHTSDWHLGKRLDGKSRILEQRDVLEQLCRVCEDNQVDVILLTGDVFDTVNPPAEAEELFYTYALKLSAGRCFVAIAGNHDNPERLKAPLEIARACGVLLIGDMDGARLSRNGSALGGYDKLEGGEGYVRIFKNGEVLNLAFLPYPSYSRMSALGYAPSGGSYSEDVSVWANKAAACFTLGGNNLFASHLYLSGSAKSDETELGTAVLLPPSVLPDACYNAMGHVHRPQKISEQKHAYYAGSPLCYSFDDTSEKYFYLVQISHGAAAVEKIPVTAGKKPVRVTVKNFEQCLSALSGHADDWVQLLYDCADPLSGTKYQQLKAYDNFCSLVNVFVAPRSAAVAAGRMHRTDKELFEAFYERAKGEKPKDSLIDLFLSAVGGEEI